MLIIKQLLYRLLALAGLSDVGSHDELGLSFYRQNHQLPLVINTWAQNRFSLAADAAWQVVTATDATRLDVVVTGCSSCEHNQCDGSVGYGNRPDSNGHVTLDAMVLDAEGMKMGAVGGLRGVRNAVGVARAVLEHTEHTLLVGEGAKEFAIEMGFKAEATETSNSSKVYKEWKSKNCQPNFYRQVLNKDTCGPHRPIKRVDNDVNSPSTGTSNKDISHDTIAMLHIDANGKIACGTSTNGLRHKISGRVGDTPIPGSGCYALPRVGAAGATGDGDIIMRFLPSLHAVQAMQAGYHPMDACQAAVDLVVQYYPNAFIALVCADVQGQIGAAGRNVPADIWRGKFPFSYRSASTDRTMIGEVPGYPPPS